RSLGSTERSNRRSTGEGCPQENRPRSEYRSAPEFCRNAAIKVISRNENRYFDTKTSSISAIPFTKNHRIREQPTRGEAVEIREGRTCLYFQRSVFWSGRCLRSASKSWS